LGVEVKIIDAATPEQLDQFMQAPLDERFNKVLLPVPDLTFWARRTEIAEYALRRGLAMLMPFRTDGALLSYEEDTREQFRIIGSYVDRIIKGEKPADLPVQLPTKFRMVINLKTAKALGITISPSILAQADEFVE
jgi:putative ABC transport system substrate-binding protein